jgi:hypothetical protein
VNDQETASLLATVQRLWPTVPFQTKVDAAMVRAWQVVLADIPHTAAEALLVNTARAGAAFPPPPGQIAEQVIATRDDLTGSTAPTPDDAWGEVLAVVQRRGWYRGMPESWSHPAVEQVARSLGWDELCHGDPMVVRAHFLRLYPEAARRHTSVRRRDETFSMLQGHVGHELPAGP